ncbi:hypothetical protein SASPL_147172 [Salvia splendens]|uniref:Uncharacterized protein n=1 Tax=Salvia splendens TaxID=180675 RepID=A0A8X8WEP5_SALSN|nr:hypothetical protein SASPL_147172 [Salvia splendens]
MTFRSCEDETPTALTKAMKLKLAKSRCKARKSTPAPSTKGDGRKRFVPSPLPEDKQLYKKLLFDNDTSSDTDPPRCRMAIFPSNPTSDEEGHNPGVETESLLQLEGEAPHDGSYDACVAYTLPTLTTSANRLSQDPEPMTRVSANTKNPDVMPDTTTSIDTPMGDALAQHGLKGDAEAYNPNNLNMASPKQPHLEGIGAKKNVDESRQAKNNMEWKQQGKHKGKESNTRMSPKASVRTGAEGDSPGKEVKDTSPSPSPKWVFRPTNAKRNMKKSATPHPIKNGGNTKRSACVPLTETGRVRKKIVFEFDELIAGTNGGGSAIAGKDGWSSLPGEREKGRWKRKARPAPFEASTGAFEVVPGVLPLLAGELRFSMGKKDGSARHQPEVVTGTRLDGALPEVNEAVAQGVLRSTRVEAAASAAVLDEDTSSERNGANMLFDPPTLAAPFSEKDRHVLASETCDSLMGQSILQFKSGDGTNFKAEDNNGGGEAGLNGMPSAPDNPSDPPDELLDQDRDQPEILPKHSASEVGIDVASPVGSPPTLGHSLEFITDKAAQAETQPVEPDLDEKPANTGAGLDSGGPPKSDAVNLDADHDTEMGTFGW